MARLNARRRSSRPKTLVRSLSSVLPWDWTSVSAAQIRLRGNIFLFAGTGCCFGLRSRLGPAQAQTDVNDVHVAPREVAKAPDPAPKKDVVATGGLTTRVRPLKVDVDLVLVPVTITDPIEPPGDWA